MPISPKQLEADVAYLTEQPEWQNEDTRRDYIRNVAVKSRETLPADEVDAVVSELWKRSEKGWVSKTVDFVGTAVEEVVKSVPATGGAAVAATTDATGYTDTGSGTRLAQGVAGLVDTTGQLLKRLPPGDSAQAERDTAVDLLKEEIDTQAIPDGVKDWLAGAYDNQEEKMDPATRSYVDSIVSGISRKSIEADHGKDEVKPYRVDEFLNSDRNPGRTDSDIPGVPGPREFLADYVATKDPASWEAFKQRVTETDSQHQTRTRNWLASGNLQDYVNKLPEDSLEREMIVRSMDTQGSPIDLATAAVPLFRGAKALQAARAGEKAATAGVQLVKGAAIEGIQEGGTELLSNPQTTLGDVGYAAGLGAVGGGVVEGGMNAVGQGMNKLTRPTPAVEPVKTVVDGVPVMRGADDILYKVEVNPDPESSDGQILTPLDITDPADNILYEKAKTVFYQASPESTEVATPETFTVDEAAAALLEAAPPTPEQNAPTETPPASSETIPPAAPPAVVEAPPAPEVTPIENEPATPTDDTGTQPDDTGTQPVADDATAAQGNASSAASSVPGDPARVQRDVPPATEQPAPQTTGVRNAYVDQARRERGLSTIYEPLKQTFGQWWDGALKIVDEDPAAGAKLVTEVLSKPRVLMPVETALLAHEEVTRENAFDRAVEQLNNATEANRESAEANLELARKYVDEAYAASDLSGTPAGQALAARKLRVNRDYSLAKMESVMRATANSGAPLTSDQEVLIRELHAKIAETQAKLDEYEAMEKDTAARDTFANLVKEIKAEGKKKAREGKTITEFLDEQAEAARKRIRSRGGNLNAGLNPLELTDRAIIGASYLAKGVTAVAEWTQAMLQDLGDSIAPYLPEILKASKALHGAEQKVFKQTVPKADNRDVMEQVAANAAEGQALPPRLVYELIKDKVKAGATTLADAVTQATADLRKVYPEITERQVRDEFSGYGKVKFPSQDDLNKKMNEFRRIAQLSSALEDALKKQAPLKSGLQRSETTPKIRALQKELTKAMKDAGLERTTGPQQLKTALDGMKSRLRNEIEELDEQIAKGERRQKSRKAPNVDQELLDLREQRDLRKKILDDLDAPVELTPDQLIERAVAAKERTRDELARRIREEDFSDTSQKTPMTQQLQVLSDEIAVLREQYNQMRDEALGSPELTEEQLQARQVAQLNRAIKALEEELAGKVKAPGRTVTPTPEITALQNKLRALREQRKAIKPRTGPTMEQRIKAAEKALEKSIADISKRIAEGDTSTRPQKTGPQTQHLQVLRDSRDSLRKTLNEIKKEQKEAAADPLAAQLKRDKAALVRRTKALKDRLDRGDFSPPVRRTPAMDEEKAKLMFENQQAKDAYAKSLFDAQLAKRTPLKKTFDTIFELFSLTRLLKTAGDLSAVLNQGGFVFFSHPMIAARQLGGMMKAIRSEEAQAIVHQRIRSLPEYKSGEMKRMGLYLSMDAGPTSALSKQEELFMSRWVEWLPKWAGGGVIRGTARAYTTYLDLIRAASYVSMKENLIKGGWTTKPQQGTEAQLKTLANFINTTSGRGSLGKLGNQAAPFLNNILFAARFGASRFEVALGVPLLTASPGTRALIAQEYAKYLVGVATALTLLSLAQDEDDEPIEWDIRSSEFAKVRFGDTRVDLLSGFQQPLVFLARVLFGETKNGKGKIKPLRQGDRPLNIFRDKPKKGKPAFSGKDGGDVINDFVRYKLSPIAAVAFNTTQGLNPVGERTDLMSELLMAPVPIVAGQLWETGESMSEERPALTAALLTAAVAGGRISTYSNQSKKAPPLWQRIQKQATEILSGK